MRFPLCQPLPSVKTVGEMEPGDYGYVVPWAVHTDGEFAIIGKGFTVSDVAHGTSKLWIYRESDSVKILNPTVYSWPRSVLPPDGDPKCLNVTSVPY